MSLLRKTVGGIAWQGTAFLTIALLQLATFAVLARLLPAASFGLVAAANVALGIALIVAQLGLATTLPQLAKLGEGELRAANLYAVVSGCMGGLGLALCADWIAELLQQPVQTLIVVACPAILLSNAAIVPVALLQRGHAFRRLFAAETLGFLGYLALTVPGALIGWGEFALVAGILGHNAGRLAALYALAPHSLPRGFSIRGLRGLVGNGVLQAGGDALAQGSVLADRMVLSPLTSTSLLGLYDRAAFIVQLPAKYLGDVLERSTLPTFSSLHHRGIDSATLVARCMDAVLVLGVAAAGTASILRVEAVGLVLGAAWVEIAPVFGALVLLIPARVAARLAEVSLVGRGLFGHVLRMRGINLGLMLVGCIIGWHWGVFGVAVGVVAAQWVYTLALRWNMRRGRPRPSGMKAGGALALTLGAVYVAHSASIGYSPWLAIPGVTVFGVVVGGAVFVARPDAWGQSTLWVVHKIVHQFSAHGQFTRRLAALLEPTRD